MNKERDYEGIAKKTTSILLSVIYAVLVTIGIANNTKLAGIILGAAGMLLINELIHIFSKEEEETP